jgi:hypothetical protein
MLWTPSGNSFGFSVDNFGATYTDAGIGVNSPGNASANVKGANTTMLAALAQDCYAMAIGFSGGNTAATIRRNLVDILIDPAGGTSWSVLIANLYCAYASLGCGGYWYYFPIYLKSGTSIGSANQSVTGTTSALRVLIRCYGKPTRPELLRVGTKVQTYGAVTGTTTGTAITPGTNALGAYTATLGTSTYDQWWWQCGLGYDDTTIGGGVSLSEATLMDIAHSTDGGTTKVPVADGIMANFSTSEQGGKAAFGIDVPYYPVPSGSTIYMRAASSIAPNTTPTCVAYGLGG